LSSTARKASSNFVAGMKEEDQKIQLKRKNLSYGKFGTREKKGV